MRWIGLLVLAALLAACGGGSSAGSADQTAEQQTGFSSAIIDAGNYLAKEDGITDVQDRIGYQTVVDGLTDQCSNSPGQIEIYTDNAEKDLQSHSIEMTRYKLMDAVFRATLGTPHQSDCAGDFAAYLVLREPK